MANLACSAPRSVDPSNSMSSLVESPKICTSFRNSVSGKDDVEWLVNVKDSISLAKEEHVLETNSSVCIFGIAHPLLKLKPEAYIPQVISIGPYHHRKSGQYQETDSYKLKMAQTMEKQLAGFEFNDLVQHIQTFEHRVRACYDRHIPQSGEVLSWMLALDTSLVLQFLRSSYRPYSGDVENKLEQMRLDPILHSIRKTPLWCAIKNDILMLENQVPLFLLQKVLSITSNHFGRARSNVSRSNGEISQAEEENLSGDRDHQPLTQILQAACLLFNPFVRGKEHLPVAPEQNPRHILDYLYHYIVPSNRANFIDEAENRKGLRHRLSRLSVFQRKPVRKMLSIPRGGISNFIGMFKKMISSTAGGTLPCATELNEAGIRFAACPSGDLRDISFKRRSSTLLLPEIKIDDSTEVVLRNLVALELYSQGTEKPLTRYTYLMDRLIDTPQDVAVLKKCGIINSQMGSDTEVAQMWNSMSKSIWENKFGPVDKAMEDANEYYRNKWRVLLAEFLRTHCSKPWLVISVLSVGVLLLLTAVQVFCLFYTCNPNSNPSQH